MIFSRDKPPSTSDAPSETTTQTEDLERDTLPPPTSFLGDRLTGAKQPNTTRMYFVNVNGLRLCPSGGDFSELCTNMA
jgi:hypothetical protein